MVQRKVSGEEKIGKVLLFLASLVVAMVVGVVARTQAAVQLGVLGSIAIGIVAGIVNPFIAAGSVQVCEGLHQWAFPDTYVSWRVEKRVLHGAFWPLTLCFWIVVSTFYAAINRLFS